MTKSSSKDRNLRDKLDGNDLDLSLSDPNEVPVKELAAFPKATLLDLSCNKVITLPSDFCGLRHLVKLDLSKTKLQQLWADFGRLVNLQHLALLNRLLTLSVRFDNPLDPVLAKVAGDCLDEKQCKQCLLLLCVAGGLVACRVTELQQQPLCTSVNTIYDSAVRGLRSQDILQWVLQTDSQQ
uniref:Leucine rich repeat containing 59 n=1 Tax=Equus asinus TaxID=9793 RepID=A0A8C4PIM6_EQUAS